jgi:hypothetical protein
MQVDLEVNNGILDHPPDPQHLPARIEEVLGPAEARRREADLRRGQTRPRQGRRSTSSSRSGRALPGDHPALGHARQEFIPFLDHDVEIRRVICSANGIESLNARYRRAIKAAATSPPSRPRASTFCCSCSLGQRSFRSARGCAPRRTGSPCCVSPPRCSFAGGQPASPHYASSALMSW